MFSTVYDKVVSATAPDTLGTFPPRVDLPASSTTLCCLSFADRFISHYPKARTTTVDGDGRSLLDRARPTKGIAMSADDLESIMESAAELGGRLAAALAGTVRSKRRDPATAPVTDLLGKVRGIFGNRLTCIGREIRVSRNEEAERDESLLLRQIHALKNAALKACNGEKWCLVVSSGGESLVACSVPLPAVEEGGACGCDFLVFDPCPRPAMKLCGSYIVKFTTVRGLQLHLLSALGEIWNGGGLSQEGAPLKNEFVGLSVVMRAKRPGAETQVDADARRTLEDSVTTLRKAEKAEAIRIKREEVEVLRRVIEKSAQHKQLNPGAPVSDGIFRLTDDSCESQKVDDDECLSRGSSPFHRGMRCYRQQEIPFELAERSNHLVEGSAPCDGGNKALESHGEDVAGNHIEGMALHALGPAVLQVGLDDKQTTGDGQTLPTSRDSSCSRPNFRPPQADVSPTRALRRFDREAGQRQRSEKDHELVPADGSERSSGVGASKGGGGAEAATRRGAETTRLRPRDEHTGGDEHPKYEIPHASCGVGICPLSCPEEPTILDDPLHRALLRSIEDEELAEYSKRAYGVYRAHGVIQDGIAPGGYRAPETKTYDLASLANQVHRYRAIGPAAADVGVLVSSSVRSHGTSSKAMPREGVDTRRVQRKDCGSAKFCIREPVRPFSPPTASSQLLRPTEGHSSPPSDGMVSGNVPAAERDNELRVLDLSEAEDSVSHMSGKKPSSSEGFRSRLRAPRAGRAANTNGSARSRQEGRSSHFHAEESMGAIPLPPPPAMATAGLARPREAWADQGMFEPKHDDRNLEEEKHKYELERSPKSAGLAETLSNEDEDGCFDLGSTDQKKAVAPIEEKSEKLRPTHQQERRKDTIEDRHHDAAALPVRAGGDVERSSHGKTSDKLDTARSSGHSCEAQTSIERSKHRPNTDTCCARIPFPPLSHSAQLEVYHPPTAKTHLGLGGGVQSHVPCSESVHGGVSDMLTALAAPLSCDIADGVHRGGNSKSDGAENTAGRVVVGAEKSPKNNEFVWFGESDTPRGQRSDEGDDTKKEAACSEKGMGAVAAAEPQIDQSSSSRRQQQRKAQLLLQMEVRRQRDIIDQAFQAREEEGRISRARIGAEVFQKVKHLRQRRTSTYPRADAARSNSSPLEQPLPNKSGPTADDSQPRELQASADHTDEVALATQPHPDEFVKASRFQSPAPTENRLEVAVKAIKPGQLVPDVARSKNVATVVRNEPSADSLAPVPPIKRDRAPRVVAAGDNPWRRLVSPQQAGLDSLVPAKREPTPPPVSFNVDADDFRDGKEGLSGGLSRKQDQVRRQERFEALRAKKMAEAEERRRGQKERQVAAREEQLRAAAAAALAVTITANDADGKHHAGVTVNHPRRPHSTANEAIAVEASVLRDKSIAHGMTFGLQHLTRNPRNNDSCARYGISPLGDSNGSSGGVDGTLPSPSAGRRASRANRGFSRRSNRKLVRNALSFLCLAGGHLEEQKARALEALDSHPASNFVILLAHTKLLSFKGLYACGGEEDGTADRVFGLGPPRVDVTMASGFFKYNSAAREFREVHSKTLGKTTDAVSMEPTRLRRRKGLVPQ